MLGLEDERCSKDRSDIKMLTCRFHDDLDKRGVDEERCGCYDLVVSVAYQL